MSKTRGILALAIVSFGLLANIYSEAINEWLDDQIHNESQHKHDTLVGLQENENWLVIPVTFEGDIFDLNRAETILDSESSASDYINQINAGKSILNTTILDEVWVSNYDIDFWGQD